MSTFDVFVRIEAESFALGGERRSASVIRGIGGANRWSRETGEATLTEQ